MEVRLDGDKNIDIISTPGAGKSDAIGRVLDGTAKEIACVDSSEPTLKFCKAHFVLGHRIKLSKESNSGSPSAGLPVTEGIDFLLRGVIRCELQRDLGDGREQTRAFTGFIVTPPDANRKVKAITAGHSYARVGKVDFTTSPPATCTWEKGFACCGSHVSDEVLRHAGLPISLAPIAIAYDENLWGKDICIFEVELDETFQSEIFLPCTLSVGDLASTFGYPCTQSFLANAKEELIAGSQNHHIYPLYASVFTADRKELLYRELVKTFEFFPEGQLVCSPGVIHSRTQTVSDSYLTVKNSTLAGNSGSPTVPRGKPGYAGGIHASGGGDVNYLVPSDAPDFVEIYKRFVLKTIRASDLAGRDITHFEAWLESHDLQLELSISNRQEERVENEFITPVQDVIKRPRLSYT